MLDLSVADDLRTEWAGPIANANIEGYRDLMNSPYTMPGVSDGGAHVKFITPAIYPTEVLSWLVRETGVLSLEEAHFRLSGLMAWAAGFKDRGTLREGMAAVDGQRDRARDDDRELVHRPVALHPHRLGADPLSAAAWPVRLADDESQVVACVRQRVQCRHGELRGAAEDQIHLPYFTTETRGTAEKFVTIRRLWPACGPCA